MLRGLPCRCVQKRRSRLPKKRGRPRRQCATEDGVLVIPRFGFVSVLTVIVFGRTVV